MDGPTRPTPPSAIDGYRRLERTRKVAAGGHVPVATAVVPPRRRVVSSARVAGMLRLAGFIAVLAVIIGTSVGLASADNRAGARRVAADTSTSTSASTSSSATSDKLSVSALAKDAPAPREDVSEPVAANDAAPEAAEAPAVEETVAVASADATPAAAAAPAGTATTSLPFTGEPSLDHVLLFGAGLVLLGMLVQIAGQPLPADRARVRSR